MKKMEDLVLLNAIENKNRSLSKIQQRGILGGIEEDWKCVQDTCGGEYYEPGFSTYWMNCGDDLDRYCQHEYQCHGYWPENCYY